MQYEDPPSIISDPPSAAALQRYAAEMHDLYHRAPCGYHSLDEDGVFLRINGTELAWLGYAREELIGKIRFVDLLTPASRSMFEGQFLLLKTRGELRDLELQIHRKNGSILTAVLNASALRGHDGRFIMCRSSLHDISSYWRDRQDLLDSREQLRALSRHLQTVREEEKRTIARELHDELGCILSTLRLDISRLQKKPPADISGLQTITGDMLSMLDDAVQTTRRLVSQLNPTILDDMGLIPALTWQLREFARRSGLDCRIEMLGDDFDLGKTCNLTLFRVLQEALTNVVRHAQASRVDVALIFEEGMLIMEIYDDGVGFDPALQRQPESHGLSGMEERMRTIGGTLSVQRHPVKGTTLQVRVFIPPEEYVS